jgi:hypothetical protein
VSNDTNSRRETAAQIVKLGRVTAWTVLALLVFLLMTDWVAPGLGWSHSELLSENVLMTFVYAIAAEAVATIAAVTILLWKGGN